MATVTAETCRICCVLQNFPFTVLAKSSTPCCAPQNFLVRVLAKSCISSLSQYSRRAPPLLRTAELPSQSTREELHKFPLTVLTKSSTPCCALQNFIFRVLAKSRRSSLSQYSRRAPPPIAYCRTSVSEYSRRAAEVPSHSTHQEPHPLLALQNFPIRVLTKSCRTSPSRYSPNAPPLCYICSCNLT